MHGLIERLDKIGSPRLALMGDFILDRYVYGDVERINPEAPVPVLRVLRGNGSVGGAGNVAAAAAALGASVACIGVIGDDAGGAELCGLLDGHGAKASSLVRLPDRSTCVKTRYIGLAQHVRAQQMLRVDEESDQPLGQAVQDALKASFLAELQSCDMVVMEDYNKGVFGEQLTAELIAAARKAGKSVIVDPARQVDYAKYRGCTLLKPNRYEAEIASGVRITDDATLELAARRLIEITDAQAVVITLDRQGALLCVRDGACKMIAHHRPVEVFDVSGAGDETLAVLAVALAAGCDHEQAVQLANVAGGLEVERRGFVPIRRHELADELRRMIGLRRDKVMDRAELVREVARRKAAGERIVFTNGCFDLLHMGHVQYLQDSRELGSALVVAINSDASVQRLKGPSRPVIGQAERAGMLAALECVDYVTIFDEDTPMALLELLRPEVMVKGGTTPVIVGREFVEGYGGKVIGLPPVEGLSTTEIINRIVSTSADGDKPQA